MICQDCSDYEIGNPDNKLECIRAVCEKREFVKKDSTCGTCGDFEITDPNDDTKCK